MNETINNVTTEVSDEPFHIWGEKFENEMPYQPFYQNIEKEGVTVYGKNREDLAVYCLETARQCIQSAKVLLDISDYTS